ncbi:DEAD-box ATP-dependent RNA helicase 26 [Selaginella moellendorffii]|nr:DEAD-box ATP-dependent RNA helicase 26 [Selaginella moellendorffii]|eukprot:XP_024535745.1 DEAD-box ATP-dependent RNA helicase 26 [Selaginella moellendorffii]
MELVRLAGAMGLKRAQPLGAISSAGMAAFGAGAKKSRVNARGFSIAAAAVVDQDERAARRLRRKKEVSVADALAPPSTSLAPPSPAPPLSSQESIPVDNGKNSHLSNSRFDQFEVHALTLKAIKNVLGYEVMTMVQEATLPLILKGEDVLAKAKTGTGKTIAFLLPTIETILASKNAQTYHENPIRALVICPTRELAMQAAVEAQTLMKFHNELGAQTAIGGNSSVMEAKKIKLQPCQILVGTPGRLLDHIQNARGFADQLKSVKILILDEADTLLDMGFRQNLTEILKALPKKRQTLLFSATIPKEVHSISQLALKPDHKFVDTVGQDTETHAMVNQKYAVVPQESQFAVLYSILKEHIAVEPKYKVLVFCTTANITAYMAALYQKLGFNIREIHSRKTQTYRTRVSDEFRNCKGGLIMFTSDVSARGIDYPDVTLVVQIGVPAAREQYIHRLGRTGRAGKEGQGVLILLPWEEPFLRKLKDISIGRMETPKVLDLSKKLRSVISDIDQTIGTRAYQSWLGYYTTAKSLSIDKHTVVEYSRKYWASLGFSSAPAIPRLTIKKMGLAGILD